MTQIKTKIPAEMEPAAVGGMVTDSKYVKDRVKNMTQEEVNADTEERVSTLEESVGTGGSVDERIAIEKNRAEQAESTLDGKIAAEKTRAEGVEGGLNTRLQTVEQLASISVGGGDIGIGTAADFESDDPSDLAKVPTVGAMLGGANDGVYDISARHNGTKYADLTAALGTNGANVPLGVRKGGMSIKFICSSNDKYVQYMCKSNTWSTIPTDWERINNVSVSQNTLTIGGEEKGELAGQLVENEEWIWVMTDDKTKIIFGFHKTDGSPHFGYGCPPQVIDYVTEKLGTFNSTDYASIKSFIGDLINGDTLATLLNKKVDKVNGLSLIDAEFSSSISHKSNTRYLDAVTDKKGAIIEVITLDGEKEVHLPFRVVPVDFSLGGYTIKEIKDSHFIKAGTDKNNKVYYAINPQGQIILFTSVQLESAKINGTLEVYGDVNDELKEKLLATTIDKQIMLQLFRQPHNLATFEGYPFTLLHFSDLHGDSENLKCIKEFADKHSRFITDVLFTGDMPYVQFSDNIDFWELYGKKFLYTIGNHETYVQEGGSYVVGKTAQEVNAKYVNPYINNWNVDSNPSNKNYWYKDYPREKIRVIGLDSMYYDSDENTWLAQALADARTNNLSVIIGTHFIGDEVHFFDCSFDDSLENTTIPYSSDMADAVVAVQSFIDAGGIFITWLAGHTHCDHIGYHTNHPKQCVVIIDTAYCGNANYQLDVVGQTSFGLIERIKGTASQNLFNIVSVDTYRKRIKIARIGARYDTYMRHKMSVCVQYGGDEISLISNN